MTLSTCIHTYILREIRPTLSIRVAIATSPSLLSPSKQTHFLVTEVLLSGHIILHNDKYIKSFSSKAIVRFYSSFSLALIFKSLVI